MIGLGICGQMAEVGFILGRSSWGKGLATEALAAVMPGARLTPDKKLYLTIREAAEYSGLPMSHLKALMKRSLFFTQNESELRPRVAT